MVVNLAYLNNETTENNVLAVKNLAYICKKKEASHLIHLSSAVVAGASRVDIITPETTCEPCDNYEITKLAIENVLITVLTGYCHLSILRPTAIFGKNGLNLVKIMNELKNGNYWINKIRVSLYGKRKMNLVSVDNVVAAILFLANVKEIKTNGCYIISDDDDELNNYADVVKLITQFLNISKITMLNLPFQKKIMSLLLRIKGNSNLNLCRVYSSEKLMQLGFSKKITLEQALLNYCLGTN